MPVTPNDASSAQPSVLLFLLHTSAIPFFPCCAQSSALLVRVTPNDGRLLQPSVLPFVLWAAIFLSGTCCEKYSPSFGVNHSKQWMLTIASGSSISATGKVERLVLDALPTALPFYRFWLVSYSVACREIILARFFSRRESWRSTYSANVSVVRIWALQSCHFGLSPHLQRNKQENRAAMPPPFPTLLSSPKISTKSKGCSFTGGSITCS